jgi:hypothetical protein
MSNAITNKNVNTRYIKSPLAGCSMPIIFYKHDEQIYVIAKSVVTAVTDTNLKQGKDPYIKRITELLSSDVIYRAITGSELISKVWGGGNFSKVVFVEIIKLLENLENIFTEVPLAVLVEIKEQIKSEVNKLG